MYPEKKGGSHKMARPQQSWGLLTLLTRWASIWTMPNTVECRYNAVTFVTILHSALRLRWLNINQTLDSQKTPHISPSRASYGVPFVRIFEKIGRVITAPHCTASPKSEPPCGRAVYTPVRATILGHPPQKTAPGGRIWHKPSPKPMIKQNTDPSTWVWIQPKREKQRLISISMG